MLTAIRKRITYTNLAVTAALVFAMSGSAYAANRYLITSTKQISPKVLKTLKGASGQNGAPGAQGPAGPAGPTGATGPQGPAGPVGEAGSTGAPGTNGANGKNGTNGKNGEPWTPNNTLPAGATETGTYVLQATSPTSTGGLVQISFPIQLATPGEVGVQIITKKQVEENAIPAGCSGNAEEPKADQGNLCIFDDHEGVGYFPSLKSTAGVTLSVGIEKEGGFTWGSWAMTAP